VRLSSDWTKGSDDDRELDLGGLLEGALRAELAGGAATGFRPSAAGGGELCFVHTLAAVTAVRPA